MSDRSGNNTVRLVQITDTHLYGNADAQLLNMNTQDSFEHVLELVSRNEQSVDAFLATGDIAQDASEDAYRRFIGSMERFSAPFYWIPGNHDSRRIMARMTESGKAGDKRIMFGNWQVLMLDSSIPGEVHGRLSADELEFLDQSLGNGDSDHSLVCLHHNPVPGTAAWMEGIGLENPDALMDVLARHDNVRAVLYGHIHQHLDFVHKGTRFLCTPSTCIQFKPGVTDFALDELSPAYRWLELAEDGGLRTGVERVRDFEFTLDHAADGY